jgi:hypothetical protein
MRVADTLHLHGGRADGTVGLGPSVGGAASAARRGGVAPGDRTSASVSGVSGRDRGAFSEIETLAAQMPQKIWRKIFLLPEDE